MAPPNRQDREFVDFVVDLMQIIGPVEARAMFGGHGLFLDQLMFALIIDRELYLKTNTETSSAFDERGLSPFQYRRAGRLVELSYRQAPEEVFDDAETMQTWANQAYVVAMQSAAGKTGR